MKYDLANQVQMVSCRIYRLSITCHLCRPTWRSLYPPTSRSFEMHEVQPCVLERVVEWLYSGEVGEISGVAEGLALLEGSRFLRVERMEAQCSAWLCAHVEASSCVAVWAEASRLGCGVGAERALPVVGRRLETLAREAEAELLGLPAEALVEGRGRLGWARCLVRCGWSCCLRSTLQRRSGRTLL
jgi:hypothetical protein